RGLARGDGLDLLDRVPLYVDGDPLLGSMLGEDLIDALYNRCLGLGSAHAPEIKGLQPLYRPVNALVAIVLIALLLLARSVPIERKPFAQMVGTRSTFDDIERLFIAVRPLAQDLLPTHVTGKNGIREGRHLGTGLGNDGDEEPVLAVDRAQVLSLCTACSRRRR